MTFYWIAETDPQFSALEQRLNTAAATKAAFRLPFAWLRDCRLSGCGTTLGCSSAAWRSRLLGGFLLSAFGERQHHAAAGIRQTAGRLRFLLGRAACRLLITTRRRILRGRRRK